MGNSILPNLKTIAASIIGSCLVTSLLHRPNLPPPVEVVDRPLIWLDKEAPNVWLRPSAGVDRSSKSTRLERKASPNDDTSAIYVYPWAGQNIRAHARMPEPSKETILFWHIPKSGGSTAKSIYKCIGKTVCVASKPETILRLEQKGLVPSGKADIIFSSFPDLAIEHLYDERHKARVLAMFRHPVDRLISKFYYLRVATWENTYRPEWKDMTILEWVHKHNADNNHMVKKLAGKIQTRPANEVDLMRAKKTVWQRMIVGVMEKMDESIYRFNTVLGINAKTENRYHRCMKRFFGGSGKEKINSHSHPKIEKGHPAWDYLAKKNQLDIELYEMVLELFEQQTDLIDSYARAPLS